MHTEKEWEREREREGEKERESGREGGRERQRERERERETNPTGLQIPLETMSQFFLTNNCLLGNKHSGFFSF